MFFFIGPTGSSWPGPRLTKLARIFINSKTGPDLARPQRRSFFAPGHAHLPRNVGMAAEGDVEGVFVCV